MQETILVDMFKLLGILENVISQSVLMKETEQLLVIEQLTDVTH